VNEPATETSTLRAWVAAFTANEQHYFDNMNIVRDGK
jgi:hypothetical protein